MVRERTDLPATEVLGVAQSEVGDEVGVGLLLVRVVGVEGPDPTEFEAAVETEGAAIEELGVDVMLGNAGDHVAAQDHLLVIAALDNAFRGQDIQQGRPARA